MGKFEKIIHEELIPEAPDRFANYLRVTRATPNEVHIQFRNLRITLLDEEVQEWKEGFTEALEKLGDHFKYDI